MSRSSVILTLIGLFVSSQAFAQDSLQVQSKNQYRNKTKVAVETKNQIQGQHKLGFIDENGDGFNDNAPDVDGDGIPNGMDEDYTGAQSRKGSNAKGFVDLDGDGINDNAMDADGDGIPNGKDADYVRTQDGTGQRKGNSGTVNKGSGVGTGNCDGTGPKGSGNKGKK